MEEGRELALLTVRRVIALRFEAGLDHFDEALQPLDLSVLKHLSKALFEVETLTEFEAAFKLVSQQASLATDLEAHD